MVTPLDRQILGALFWENTELSALEMTSALCQSNHIAVSIRLRSLERRGFLRAREGEPLPQRGGRPRFYYSLTAAGRAELESR